MLDGGDAPRDGRTPTRLNLRPGQLHDLVEAPGYITRKQAVVAEAGLHPEIDFSLEKLSTLRIEADVGGAERGIDDKRVGAAPLWRELKAGVYRVLVPKAGFAPSRREVGVKAGDQVWLIVVSLPPLPVSGSSRCASTRRALGGAPRRRRVGTAPLHRRIAAGRTGSVVAAGRLEFRGELPSSARRRRMLSRASDAAAHAGGARAVLGARVVASPAPGPASCSAFELRSPSDFNRIHRWR